MTDSEDPLVCDECGQGITTSMLLNRDVGTAISKMSHGQGRYLVDLYYQLQELRKATNNQVRALTKSDEPVYTIGEIAGQLYTLERHIIPVVDAWTDQWLVGRWAKSITGIGPVITAGLNAHIDITRAPTFGSIWAYAGVAPDREWKKGEKRPWNHKLKVLTFKIGDSFVKVSGKEHAFYGGVYKRRKKLEIDRNEAGDNAEEAAATLQRLNIQEPHTKAKYKSGKLPDGRLHQRAMRYAAKLFLAHYHEVAYVEHYGMLPPLPYPIANPDMPLHTIHKEIPPPNIPDQVAKLRKEEGRNTHFEP